MRSLSDFLREEAGAAAAEYALILGAIAAIIVVSLGVLGNTLSNTYGNVSAGFAS